MNETKEELENIKEMYNIENVTSNKLYIELKEIKEKLLNLTKKYNNENVLSKKLQNELK